MYDLIICVDFTRIAASNILRNITPRPRQNVERKKLDCTIQTEVNS